MYSLSLRLCALALLAVVFAGCAVTPLREAAEITADRVEERGLPRPQWPGSDTARPTTDIPQVLTLQQALALAFARNPGIRAQYSQLGIGQADLAEAARLSNPALSFGWLDHGGDSRLETTRGIVASFSDLLLLPSRRRLSSAEFRRLQLEVAADLVRLAHAVEASWYRHVGAVQIVAMRAAAADAARTEAELARRYHKAGNIDRLQLEVRAAAAARADVNLLRARGAAAGSREELAALLAVPVAADWRTHELLPLPPDETPAGAELLAQALADRYDLAAAREEIAMLEDALGVTRRWRLLGDVQVGYTRELEDQGSPGSGPTLDLAVPLFNQGQPAVARAAARLMDARARGDALALTVENEVMTASEQVALAFQAADRLRKELLPGAASIVARRQERVNFMLDGVFDLIQARQLEYDAWQEYFESVRDYWLARTALRAAVGGSLPGDAEARPPAVGIQDIVPAAEPEAKPAPDPHHQHGDES